MSDLKTIYEQAGSKSAFAADYLTYLSDLMAQLDVNVIEQIMNALMEAGESGHTTYFIANGGSASVASHYANDIGFGIYKPGCKPYKAVSLTDNVAVITALANDTGFENIFIRQLEALLQPGDIVFAMSVSGNSPNIVDAVKFARQVGALTIGLTGFDGGALRDAVDISLHVQTPAGEYGPVEDVFQIVDHLIYTYFRMSRLGRLAH